MPQQVEMKSSKRNSSEISDNNNKQHISNQNAATQQPQQQPQQPQQRSKRSRQQQKQQQQQQQQHIYENLPTSTTSQQLRKYFRREAIYENLCRGCGYGVFAAQGHYCHFCQCIVSGSVAAALQQQPSSSHDLNIYENICERCRSIYSDSEQCDCAAAAELVKEKPLPLPQLQSLPQSTSTLPPTMPAAAAAAGVKAGKSRTLLNYSKSSAATLTRLFGSLKQLNRSGSLQRRLFQREGSAAKAGSSASGGGGGGSLEIIHNVDEVFRTQATFDMQRICELKHQRQLQCSRSDQHIYGRLRGDREAVQQPEAATATEPEPEPELAKEPLPAVKKPRVSRMRLLRQDAAAAAATPTSASASLYLNESICQWMNSLRRELHSYEDANCQQPKSVPPAYEREREREREREQEAELVTLRRSELTATATATATATEPAAAQQHLINEFKRKLLAQRVQLETQLDTQLDTQLVQQQLEPLSERRRRRCGINERHDAAFVTEFLSGLPFELQPAASLAATTTATIVTKVTTTVTTTQAALLAALSSSLHGSVICFFSNYHKLLSAFLHSRQRRQRLRSGAKLKSNNESATRRRRLWEPMLLELAVVEATPASDDVAVASCVGSVNDTIVYKANESVNESVSESVRESKSESESVSECECEQKARSYCSDDDVSSDVGSAVMAAPKQSGDADRDSSDDSENNNNSYNDNKQCDNVSQQQQQLQKEKQQQQQQTTQNCVIKVRRPAPQVPTRNPSTALSRTPSEEGSNSNSNSEMGQLKVEGQQEQEEEEEESIYQTIWQFKTLEPLPGNNDEDFEIIAGHDAGSDDDADADADVDVDVDDAEAEALTLQAAAAFAAGARHKLTKQTTSTSTSTAATTATATPASTPLPSPTASMDHGAWETDDEFMFAKADEQQLQQQQQQRGHASLGSVGSTVTNSTATLGSISSAGSSGSGSSGDSGRDLTAAQAAQLLTHPLLRNICICYSLKEPQKYSAIFYDYQPAQIHLRFMTRIRRPAPPPPTAAATPAATATFSNDDSGCSCEADSEDLPEHIPQPLKEDWALAVLAAAASSKRGVAARAGRKLRVRSSARRLIPTSVLAWREQLQDVNCCEDEEDMIVPVTDILRAQQIQEDNEVQQTQQTTILQRFKSASIGNLVDLPGEDDKKSIKNRMRMKFAVNSNVFRLNRSPKSEKKSRSRRSQVNSLCLDEQSNKYPLFAARLNALELNMSDHPYVPRFVVDVCAHIERPDCIEQDGLYRASGNKLLVDELKRKLTHLYDPRWLQTDDIHTLTSLHKQFFRELPAPLITQEAYEHLGRSLTDDAAIERMRLAFDEMPEPNRSTLRFLIKHLTNVAAASSSNRMPASNLAIVWGPCLLAANDINFDIGRMNMLAKVLIENYERIFRPANERLVC